MSEDKLREELLANQAFRRDLLKWKIILSGGALAIGLGFTSSTAPYAHLALCSVPLIVAYCDLLIRDADFRIAMKAFFLLNQTDDIFSQYEEFIESSPISRTKWWIFHNTAEIGSSTLLCGIVIAIGIYYGVFVDTDPRHSWIPLIASGLIGIIIVVWVHVSFMRKRNSMRDGFAE